MIVNQFVNFCKQSPLEKNKEYNVLIVIQTQKVLKLIINQIINTDSLSVLATCERCTNLITFAL